jgi:hypothetical protein
LHRVSLRAFKRGVNPKTTSTGPPAATEVQGSYDGSYQDLEPYPPFRHG